MALGLPIPRRGRRVGLCITDRALHAVEVAEPGPRLVRRAVAPLPPGVVVDGSVREREPFAQVCRALWSEGRWSTRSVVASLGSQDAVVRMAELPPLARRDVHGALRFELADLLPFSVDDAAIDSVELGRSADDVDGQVVRHLVVAARSTSVEALAGALRSAGLRPRAFDLAAFAAVRLDLLGAARSSGRGHAAGDRPAVPTAVVLEGDGVLTIAVHVGGQVHFARTLHLDQSIDQELSAVIEAELSAIDVHRTGGHAGAPGARTDPVSEAVTATLEHVRTTDPEAAPRVVHVLGTSASAGGLAQAIDERTGLPTHVRNLPWEETDPLRGADLLAAGHAVHVVDPAHGPPWPRLGQVSRANSARDLRRRAVAVTAAIGLGAVAGTILAGPDPAPVAAEADALQSDVDDMTAQLSALEEQDAQATELAQLERLVEEVEATTVRWPAILAAIEAGRPDGSSLLAIEATGGDEAAEEPGALRLTIESADTTAVEPWLALLGGIDGLSDPWLEVASATDSAQAGGPATFTVRAEVTTAAGESPG
jgi:type IV pilus assembly protein PilM